MTRHNNTETVNSIDNSERRVKDFRQKDEVNRKKSRKRKQSQIKESISVVVPGARVRKVNKRFQIQIFTRSITHSTLQTFSGHHTHLPHNTTPPYYTTTPYHTILHPPTTRHHPLYHTTPPYYTKLHLARHTYLTHHTPTHRTTTYRIATHHTLHSTMH